MTRLLRSLSRCMIQRLKYIFQINNSIASVHAAAFLIASAGLISRILGLLRNRLLAAHFGASRELDIYFAAFQIPDFVATIFLLGAGSAAILPVFQEYLQQGQQKARHLISSLQTSFLIASSLLGIIVFFFVPALLHLLVPGFSDSDRAATTVLTRIMLLSPILLGLSSIFSSVIQSFQRFFAYALAPILYNLGIIAGIIFFVPLFGIAGLGLGVVFGALLHLIIQIIALIQIRMHPYFVLHNISKGVKKVLGLSLPRVISLSLAQLTVMGLTILGSTLHAGSIAVFELSQDLYFLPIALIGVSYSVVLFPRLNEAFLQKNGELFYRELFIGIRTIIFWIAPTIALFIVLRAHIVRVAFGAGQFSWEDTRLTAASLAILSIAMIMGSIIPLLIKAFYAIEKTWAPLAINMASSGISIGTAIIFSRALRGQSNVALTALSIFRVTDIPSANMLGLALGFTSGLVVDGILLIFALRYATQSTFGAKTSFPIQPFAHIGMAAIIAGFGAYMIRLTFTDVFPLITLRAVLLQGIIAGVAGFVMYAAILILLKNEDIKGLRRACTRKLINLRVLPPSWDTEM